MRWRLTPRGLRLGHRCFPCSIGRGGLTRDKREGDGATPRGLLHVEGLLYRPDRMARPAAWARPIGPSSLWCDAAERPEYNQPVRAPFSASHEKLRRADPLYDLIVILDWNRNPAVAGKGSAIFLHVWRAPHFPTAGCLALPKQELKTLLPYLKPGTAIEI